MKAINMMIGFLLLAILYQCNAQSNETNAEDNKQESVSLGGGSGNNKYTNIISSDTIHSFNHFPPLTDAAQHIHNLKSQFSSTMSKSTEKILQSAVKKRTVRSNSEPNSSLNTTMDKNNETQTLDPSIQSDNTTSLNTTMDKNNETQTLDPSVQSDNTTSLNTTMDKNNETQTLDPSIQSNNTTSLNTTMDKSTLYTPLNNSDSINKTDTMKPSVDKKGSKKDSSVTQWSNISTMVTSPLLPNKLITTTKSSITTEAQELNPVKTKLSPIEKNSVPNYRNTNASFNSSYDEQNSYDTQGAEYKGAEPTKTKDTKKENMKEKKTKQPPLADPLDMKCVQCNSYINPESCGATWDSYSHIVNCRNLSNIDPTQEQACSTIRQTVQGDFRVIRFCINKKPTTKFGCIDRIGTHKIKISYCSCQGDICNQALNQQCHSSLLLLVIAVVMMFFITA